jgi:Tfp pilus assembly protein PilO
MKSFKQILIIAGLFFLVFGVLFFMEFRKNSNLKAELETKTARIVEAKEAKSKTEKLQSEISELHNIMVRIEEKIPQDEGIPLDLMRKISLLADNLGFKKIEYQYLAKSGGITQVKVSAGNDLVPSAGSEAKPLRIAMSFECQFTKLAVFLRNISKLERLVLLEKLTVARVPEINPRQRVSLELTTYTFVNK